MSYEKNNNYFTKNFWHSSKDVSSDITHKKQLECIETMPQLSPKYSMKVHEFQVYLANHQQQIPAGTWFATKTIPAHAGNFTAQLFLVRPEFQQFAVCNFNPAYIIPRTTTSGIHMSWLMNQNICNGSYCTWKSGNYVCVKCDGMMRAIAPLPSNGFVVNLSISIYEKFYHFVGYRIIDVYGYFSFRSITECHFLRESGIIF